MSDNLSVNLAPCQYGYLPVYLPANMSTCESVYLPSCLNSSFLKTNLSLCQSIWLPICISANHSANLSKCPSVYLPICLNASQHILQSPCFFRSDTSQSSCTSLCVPVYLSV